MPNAVVLTLLIGFIYSHLVYPAILTVVCWFVRRPTPDERSLNNDVEGVSLIVAAYNEERSIRAKIEDSLKLRKARVDLEIIVASDCSDDATDEIVLEYEKEGVQLVRANERKGKEHAQWLAIQVAKGELLVFSDVATRIPLESFRNMVAYFSNKVIGAVSSRDKLIDSDGRVSSEGNYVRYEMWVRAMESKLAGVIGMSGSFFAIRKALVQPWDTRTCSDFQCAVNAVGAGYAAVAAPDVFGHYPSLSAASDEYARRVRTVLRGMSGLYKHRRRMLSLKRPLFAFQMFSHKVMRWLSPWFFIALFLALLPIWWQSLTHSLIFTAQLAMMLVYALSKVWPMVMKLKGVELLVFFIDANVAVLDAGIRFILGRRVEVWQPSKR